MIPEPPTLEVAELVDELDAGVELTVEELEEDEELITWLDEELELRLLDELEL